LLSRNVGLPVFMEQIVNRFTQQILHAEILV
jgi:hypothetical protein